MAPITKLATLATLLLVLTVASAVRTTTSIGGQICEPIRGISCKCEEEAKRCRLEACYEFTRGGPPVGSVYCKPPPQCCQQLNQVSYECRCSLIKQMASDVLKGGCEADKEREMRERAETLTSGCGCTPQRCSTA